MEREQRKKRARRDDEGGDEQEGRPSIVRLNVGGTHYDVSASLLQSQPDSMLARICSSTWEGNRVEDADGRIFLDRNGKVFGDILDYLRTGPTVLEFYNDERLHLLKVEADYFGLDELRNTIDAMVLANDENGVPICFRKDCWTRIQGQVRHRRDGNHSSWVWRRQSGNTRLLQHVDDPPHWRLMEDGIYLLFVRLYHSPHYRMTPDSYYVREQADELCRVTIARGVDGEIRTIARFGCWDHREEEETESSPMVASGTCMEIVTLFHGDGISIRYPCDRRQLPVRRDTPPDLFQSLTIIKLSGTAAARYVRKRVPQDAGPFQQTRAAWSPVGLLIPPSKFVPNLLNDYTALEPSVAGTYLVFGRVAVTTKSTTDSDNLDSLQEQSAQFRALLPDGLALRSNHTIVLSECDTVWRGNLSEPCAFMDVMHLEPGCKLDFVTKGEVILENHGTTNTPDDKIPWQSLTMMRLDPHLMFDRFEVTAGGDPRWTRTVFSLGPTREPLLNIRGRLLVVPDNQPKTLLILGSFPPLSESYKLALTVNGVAVAMSQTLPNSGHHHNFYEILELEGGATVGISKWSDSFVLDNQIQFLPSTRGHLCVVQLD